MSMPSRSSPSPFSTDSSRMAAGGASRHHQRRAPLLSSRIAWAYVLPAERSEAASFTTSNQGCPSSATRHCCPAMPVAPTTATRFFMARFLSAPKRARPATTGRWSRAPFGSERLGVSYVCGRPRATEAAGHPTRDPSRPLPVERFARRCITSSLARSRAACQASGLPMGLIFPSVAAASPANSGPGCHVRLYPAVVLLIAATLPSSASGQLRPRSEGRAVVIEGSAEGPLVLTLGTKPTGVRYVEVATTRGFPTIDITCDGKRRTFPMAGSADTSGTRTVAVYEVGRDEVHTMLGAVTCRLFLPGHDVELARDQRWAAWADASKGAAAPRVLSAKVVGVLAGDTIEVQVGDRTETVRYIGTKVPEPGHPGARDAADANRQRVAGRQVRLELDVQERDPNGRLLAYVWVGDSMINAELVRRGFADVTAAPPNVRHQELLAKLHREAREQKRGLWAAASEPAAAATLAVDVRRAGASPLDAWTCPPTYPIKGNFTTYSGERCIHHSPGDAFYGKTKPERCYATEEDARQDGCRRAKR